MQDVRIALRNLRTRPGFTLVAVLTLALGIGANTAVFTVVNAVLLQALPYEDPSRVVVLTEQTPQFPTVSVTRYNYDDWRARSRSFAGVGAVRATSLTISGGSEPERVPAKMISATLLPLLGVTPAEGRGFDERDDQPGAEGVVLLADGFARRRYPSGWRAGAAPAARQPALHRHRRAAGALRTVPARRPLRAVRPVGGDVARGSRAGIPASFRSRVFVQASRWRRRVPSCRASRSPSSRSSPNRIATCARW